MFINVYKFRYSGTSVELSLTFQIVHFKMPWFGVFSFEKFCHVEEKIFVYSHIHCKKQQKSWVVWFIPKIKPIFNSNWEPETNFYTKLCIRGKTVNEAPAC